ncbi:uncharacterized protein K460DRAFT_371579 [Cucurbitaria berberidis CBS 394.84]|uniref:DUF7707 domain-containing protein n=1 Tax=Cucurbitaria berberidis CBS 394.84 TaxID=1168544 RepID=A0A9P4G7Z0_9PLEO|nr:uncharacterized protein K460DRAFT_371579 [Cucurbitaria berberidis CBS 394.84]KAF1840385.1 hypothetical protein K460DRAFT_371579 [Cucurbitaria berberidis CBS 394.84]
MRSAFALGVAAFAGLCAAQNQTQSEYPYRIDPNSVTNTNRQYWCDQNKAQCPLICLQQPDVTSMTTTENDCDPNTLTYSCVCEKDITPNITQYSQTLPFFICQEWGNQCVAGCNGVNTCESDCRSKHPCGAQKPFLGNASLSSTMSSTQSPTGSSSSKIPITGFGGATGTNTAGAVPAAFVPGVGLSIAAVFGSAFLGFAILL